MKSDESHSGKGPREEPREEPQRDPAVVLAIESSQREVSVAIRTRTGEVQERVASGDPRERDLLLPAIATLLAEEGLSPGDLRAVAVSTGPGGFTGLRVAIATAKGICEALAIPAIDVPSALVAAMGARAMWWPRDSEVIVALASKGEECWISTIAANDSGHLMVREARSMNAATFDIKRSRLVLADDHLPAAIRQRAVDSGAAIALPTFRASDCLAAAEQLLAAGDVRDAGALRVRYPREPEAVALWRARYPDGFTPKQAGKAARPG